MTHTSIQRTGLAALGATAIALLFANIIGNSEQENGNVGFYFVSLAICAALGYWLFTRVVPRAVESGPEQASKRGLVLGVIALVAGVAAFWAGLGYVLGAAAVSLGVAQRSRGASGTATVVIVLGALAILANTAIIVMDSLAT